jgi:diguanylate cyclase (GGDEF)-like protein
VVKILCVEDDESLVKLLKATFVSQNYQVEIATDGQSAWDLAETSAYDLILLDLVLPKLNGLQFCQRLRSRQFSSLTALNRETPVLLMTAVDTVTNKVMGLDAGADDYVTKPLDLDELMARVRALLRRSQAPRSPLLEWGNLCLNPNNCEVTFQGQPVGLAAKEYAILELFLRHPDQIFSPGRLLNRLWSTEDMPTEGAVRSQIKGLRQKLKQAGSKDIFETLYKLGYRLRTPIEPVESGPSQFRPDCSKPLHPEVLHPEVLHPEVLAASPAALPITIAPELGAVWQECWQGYRDRLSIIQQAIETLQAGHLTAAEKLSAEREAHTLTGSLGSFGLHEASRLAYQLQQVLKQDPLSRSHISLLEHLTTTLQQQIEGTQVGALPVVAAPRLDASADTVLVVDDDFALGQQLATEAIAWDIQVQAVTSLALARQALTAHSPSALLLDLNFADSAETGLSFLAELKAHHAEIPVLVFTADESLTQRVEAARLGCQGFLQKPIAPLQVLEAVMQAMQQSSRSGSRVLIVDDDPSLLHLLETLLTPQGYAVTLLDQPQHFWQILEQTAPDLVILDVNLSSDREGDREGDGPTPLNGIDLCQVMRNDSRWNRLPILFLSARSDPETVHQGFRARADDFLSKPVVVAELLTRIQTRLEQRKLWEVTDVDELTGVSLRRRALQSLGRLLQMAKRQQQPFSLAILDVDHFKQVNDQHGHQEGDRVLSYLGKLLLQSFRAEDVVGRWGGEEFVIGMYGITQPAGVTRLTEVLHQLRQHRFTTLDGCSFSVTLSAGIAQFPNDGDDWQALYQRADERLYRAKHRGRDQVVD